METFSNPKSYAIFSTPANRKIIQDLETGGARVFQFSPLETEKDDEASIYSYVKTNLAEFEWLIFTDVFTVDFFLQILEMCEIDFFELDEKHILAFGEAVSDRLRFSQIHTDVIPISIETDGIFSAILNYLQTENLAKTKFLMLKFAGFETGLKDKLLETGAQMTELAIYKIIKPSNQEIAKLKALLTGGAIDEFIFTSPEDVFFLQRYLFPAKIFDRFQDIKTRATNEITSQTLRENQLFPTFVAPKIKGS